MEAVMRVPGIPYVQGRNDYRDWDAKKYGIAIHNTSNDASDEGEASYASRRTDGVSAHLYVDHDSVTQSLDLDDRAGHAGSTQGNDHSIAVEITGANGKPRSWWLKNVAWDKLGKTLAWIITNDPDYAGFEVRRATVAEMRRNPRVKAFYGHDDMRRAWGGTSHTDPGRNFPWDRLLKAVNEHLQEDDMPSKEEIAKETVDELERRRYPRADKTGVISLPDAAEWGRHHAGGTKVLARQLVKGQVALLAALQGLDTQAILARIDQRAEEDAARDEAMLELLGQHASGALDADAVVRRIGELLTAQPDGS